MSFYRTRIAENKLSNIVKFLQELSALLNKAVSKYDNIIIMGDINIDVHDVTCVGFKELAHFMDTFGLKNLVKDKTCFFKGSCIDIVFLTNRHRKFYTCQTCELGISDCHKIITTCLRVNLSRLRTKNIIYRSFKNFDKESF